MKNHAWRPFLVAGGAVALLLTVRANVVPSDFGVNGRSFTYGFYRKGAIAYWKAVKVKYRGREYCQDCHDDKEKAIMASPHKIIQCENCHGPAIDHPDNPPKLTIDRSRGLCLRCHALLPYPGTNRASIPGIDPDEHNPRQACVDCHNPHHPNLEDMK